MKKYYFYSFDNFYGIDKVVECETANKFLIGSLYLNNGEFLLNLGETISYPSILVKKRLQDTNLCLFYKNFLSKNTLEIINYIVYEFFSLYRKVVPLFVFDDISSLFKKCIKSKNKPSYLEFNIENMSFTENVSNGQQLILFPDLWSIFNVLDQDLIEKNGTKIMHSQDSISSKSKIFREIKSGKLSTLVCTHSQMFQDRPILSRIIIIDPYKWYYKNQQNPRYCTKILLNKFAQVHGAKLLVKNDFNI